MGGTESVKRFPMDIVYVNEAQTVAEGEVSRQDYPSEPLPISVDPNLTFRPGSLWDFERIAQGIPEATPENPPEPQEPTPTSTAPVLWTPTSRIGGQNGTLSTSKSDISEESDLFEEVALLESQEVSLSTRIFHAVDNTVEKCLSSVISAKAGLKKYLHFLDSRF